MTLTRDTVLKTIREFPDRLDNKGIARRMDVKGEDRRELRSILRDLVSDGQVVLSAKKTYRETGALPSVMVLRITALDRHGDLIGIPDPFKGETEPPKIIVHEGGISSGKHKKGAKLGVGGRALCRIKEKDGHLFASVLKILGEGPSEFMGIAYQDGRGWVIKPVDKKSRNEYRVKSVKIGTKNQTLVMFRATNRNKNRFDRVADITEYLGPADGPKAATLISLKAHNIPVGFTKEVIKEAKALKLPKLSKYREDLRKIPLITIDPVDAKDFDDAVYAVADDDKNNKGGWIVWVAIADVSAFVKSGSALDKSAEQRGNSVYLPDRVEPMLPDELSSDLCSLRPNEDRACMAVKMRFKANGAKLDHVFTRGLMRSHARLTYSQAQEGFDGKPGPKAKPVMKILTDIYAAYEGLRVARKERAPLEIDLPERRVHVNDKGEVTSITLKERFDAHKLIEEFMVQANVAAAEALAKAGVPTIVRNHEPPSREKLQGLSDFLPALGLKWALGEKASPRRFNKLLEKAAKLDLDEAVGMSVLRSQSQAYYSPNPKGHFGLSLTHYGHFTSPIRRYADLVVHRALIKAFDLGEDGTSDREASRLQEISEHISTTERRAMAAERDANDRYIAQYLEGKIGAEFDARISGVTKFGLFITLDETGADGLITARGLGGSHSSEYYIFEEKKRALTGVDTGNTYRFGRKVKVRLKECDTVTGGMIFEMVSKAEKGPKPKRGSGSFQKLSRRERSFSKGSPRANSNGAKSKGTKSGASKRRKR